MSTCSGRLGVLMRLAALRGERLDPSALRAVLEAAPDTGPGTGPDSALHSAPDTVLAAISREFDLPPPRPLARPDPASLPVLMIMPEGWAVLVAHRGAWVAEVWDRESSRMVEREMAELPEVAVFFQVVLSPRMGMRPSRSPALRLIGSEILTQKGLLAELASATLALNLLAVAASLYTMQVYDRVIPSGAQATLLTLTLGVACAVALELFGRMIRTGLRQRLSDAVDRRLARGLMGRLIGVRFDALPQRPGSEAQRLRGYESVRTCLIGAGLGALIDLPMALSLLALVAVIAGWLALIPAAALLAILIVSLAFRRRSEAEAATAGEAQSRKSGILVEYLEGAEVVKSAGADWRVMARWLEASDRGRRVESRVQSLSERLQSVAAAIQQGAHVGLVAGGAMLAAQGKLSMGALIACTMLLNRITAPAAALPGLVLQWGRMRTALADLDALWALPQDHAAGDTPLVPQRVAGALSLSELSVRRDGRPVLEIGDLKIEAGERVGLVGTVGAGKTTLLRVMSGLHRPDAGRAALDGLDLAQVDRRVCAGALGYVPQEARLFAGTLRDNLLMQQDRPDDDHLIATCRRTGLFEAVVATHPRGLDRPIEEGGVGLSGGQRQLVHLTRALLGRPSVWLLDEPSAAMDQPLERRVIEMLRGELDQRPATLILATHKPQLLALTDRLIVLANGRVRLDGPREEVAARLRGMAEAAA